VPQARIEWDDRFGTPTFVGSTACFLTPPVAGGSWDALHIVSDYLDRNHDLFGIDAAGLATARRSRDFTTRHNGARHLTFQQTCDGLDLDGAVLRVSLTGAGEIISIGSTMLGRPHNGFRREAFAVPRDRAVLLAAEYLARSDLADTARQAHANSDGSEMDKAKENPPLPTRAVEPVEVRRLYFPQTSRELRPAWEIVLPDPGTGAVFELLVDACDGRLLRTRSRTWAVTSEDAAFRVYPWDSPAPGTPGSDSPDGQQFPLRPSDLRVASASEVAPFSPNGWIDDGVNETQGNNVDAHTDLNGDDQPDLPRPSGLPYRVFDYPCDPGQQDPSGCRDAAVVNLFYAVNVFHDRLYELGFDEPAGNFQGDNFGQGGAGGDRIQANAQDPRAINGAAFTAGAIDGSPARLEMYVFPNAAPDRDSSLAGELIFHELAHGVSIRLLQQLSGDQPLALAEGWGDWLAIALLAESGDDPHGTYPFGAFLAYHRWPGYENNYYFGLRRFPYSTDLNKSPQTYADIDPGQQSYPPGIPRNTNVSNTANEPHNAGEIWCAALLEARARLIETYGFAGNAIMLQLVVDGMKLAAVNPTFLQARDAILQADLIGFGGAHYGELWNAFARRGLGYSAQSPSTSASGVVEAYDLPVIVFFAYPNGRPETVDPGTDADFMVRIFGLGGATPQPGTARLHYSLNESAFVEQALAPMGPDMYEATLPAASCFGRFDYYFTIDEASGATVSDPPSAPADTYRSVVANGAEVLIDDSLEQDSGWTVGDVGDGATGGIWSRMDPQGTSQSGTAVQPEDDHTPAPGVACWVTDGLAGSSAGARDVDGGKTTLKSPSLALAGQDARVGYWRWYSNHAGGSPNEDVFVVSLSGDNGQTWHEVETVGPAGPEAAGGWYYHEFFVSQVIPPLDSVLLRFVASDYGGGSLVEAAVDDIQATLFLCGAITPGDYDGDGDIDLDDAAALYDCLGGPDSPPALNPPADESTCRAAFDFDADTDVDLSDFAEFEALLAR